MNKARFTEEQMVTILRDVEARRCCVVRPGKAGQRGVTINVMKLCSPSNGCETRPVKGDPPTPVASLAASAVTKTPMRRHASEWAVGFAATK